MDDGARRRVAVIGAGVSGLTAARTLAPHAEVVVFEADGRLGGHANTVEVLDPRAGALGVDTGFIVLNDTNYPTFRGMLEELGVPIQDSEMGMSIARADGSFEFANTRRGLFAQRSNLASRDFLRLIADQLRFNRAVRLLIGDPEAPTVGEFLRAGGYSEFFARNAISPLVSAVWSTGPDGYESFPLGFLAEFLDNHGMLSQVGRPVWQTVTGGSRTYVEALAAGLPDIRLRAPVERVERHADRVVVHPADAAPESFDEVVVAAHSDQALAMLAEPTPAEREVLGAIGYSANEATLHTDGSLMPSRRRAWASWNFHLRDEPSELTRVTYWMNNLQRLDAERDYLVSLNMAHEIDPGTVIATIPYAHPIIDHAAERAQARWTEISGADRIHFCGAYWRWAFHEDGCWSGLRAAHRLLAQGRERAAIGVGG
ncbi:NAD(P)-binding protein [Thermoleophilia bacterium SCSIO 60948]|nr:NAD(P)-binding protein [Thermoleophilia bacterium SCSIO 60948]